MADVVAVEETRARARAHGTMHDAAIIDSLVFSRSLLIKFTARALVLCGGGYKHTYTPPPASFYFIYIYIFFYLLLFFLFFFLNLYLGVSLSYPNLCVKS